MAIGTTIVCNDCSLSEGVMLGALMSGIELAVCACRSCQGFVTLERNLMLDEPPPEPVCPTCAGPVESIGLDGDRIIAQGPTDWRDRNAVPHAEPHPIGCPACGGELHAEGVLFAD